jgi:hypothetical protein
VNAQNQGQSSKQQGHHDSPRAVVPGAARHWFFFSSETREQAVSTKSREFATKVALRFGEVFADYST